MADEKGRKQMQKSQPKKGKPIEIPVPKREDFDKLIRKAAKPSPPPTRPADR